MGRFKVTPETKEVHCRVKIGDNPETDGIILRQKSTTRFIVSDGSNTGVCIVSDFEDNNLRENTMTISVTKNDGTVIRVEQFNNKFAVDFNSNRYVVKEGIDAGTHEKVTVITDEIKAKLRKSDRTTKTKKSEVTNLVEKEIVQPVKVKVPLDPKRMRKQDLADYGKSLGVDLDIEKTKNDMIADLKEFQESKKETIQTELFEINDDAGFYVATDLE
jgi:hypothetical protein